MGKLLYDIPVFVCVRASCVSQLVLCNNYLVLASDAQTAAAVRENLCSWSMLIYSWRAVHDRP